MKEKMEIEIRATGKTAPYGIGELIERGFAKTDKGISRIVKRSRGISRYVLRDGVHVVQDPDGNWVANH